jgi:hypothetical protein
MIGGLVTRTKLLILLPTLFNTAVMLSAAWDRDWVKALYWFGAVCICVSLWLGCK